MGFFNQVIEPLRYLAQRGRFLNANDDEKAHILIGQLMRLLPRDEKQSILTYEGVMKYFKIGAPKSQKVKKGVLLCERDYQGVHVVQIFMNDNDEVISDADSGDIPAGRQLLADSLDKELEDFFGESSIVIIE